MIKLINMLDCSYADALEAWNEGFKGYNFNMSMTISKFNQRLTKEDLSPELSWVANSNQKPVGLILSGIRDIRGKKIAWNGGTGIAPEFRGKGVGRQLVEKSLETYQSYNVDECYLEAITSNTKAINLYEKLNYKVIDYLSFYKENNSVPSKSFRTDNFYSIKESFPQNVKNLPFYQQESPWQTQWQSLKSDRAIIAYENNQPIGFTLYQQQLNDQNELQVILYQCSSLPNISREKTILVLNTMLHYIYNQDQQVTNRTAINIPKSNYYLVTLLEETGFGKVIEQVHMSQHLN